MTQDEYATLTEFSTLPIYGMHDPRCSSIDTLPLTPPDYESVLEADTIALANMYLRRRDLEPRGAIRNEVNDEVAIFVYFWKKRAS